MNYSHLAPVRTSRATVVTVAPVVVDAEVLQDQYTVELTSTEAIYTLSMPPAVSTRDPRRATQVTLKAVVMLSGVVTLLAVFSVFFSARPTSELQQSRQRVDTLRSDIARLQTENAHLRAEIDSVRKSTYAVERIAREDLGMSRKGEVVYMLPRDDQQRADPARLR